MQSYASYAQSLYFDHDLLFINEFEAWHKPIFITSTGYASALQNIGVAFFWIPFLAIAHRALVVVTLVFPRISLDSSIYFHALNFGNWLYGLVALTLCFHLSRRYFSPRATLLALFFTSLASPFFYYMTYFAPNPVMPSVLMATAFIITWDFTRRNGHWPHWLLLGSIGGILLSLANYNVSFICFPLITLVASVRSHHTVRTTINDAIAFALGLLLGFLPQLLAWRILFGGLTIPYAGQLDWLHPRIMEVLFSTYHGLYFYAPFLLLATAGILLLGRRDRVFAFGMIAALLVQTYVSGINLAWWAGGSFGMRYLLPLTPVFVVGAASLFEARPRVWLYLLGYLCLIWTYMLFLGFYSGGVASIEFYPLHQQWENLLTTLKDLPRLVPNHLLSIKSRATPFVVLPFTIISLAVLQLMHRLMTSVRLLSSQRFVLALALSPILLVALLLRAEEVGAAHLKDYQTQATYQAFPRAVGDPWDLSYSYSERAKYELRSGDMRAADADFQRAYDLYRQNSWTRLTLSDLERIPNRVDWQFANGVNLVGYTPEDTTGTVGSPLRIVLYWSVRTEPPAAFDVQILIKDVHGQTLGETTTTPTQAQYSFQDWKVRDVVRESYVIPYTTPPLSTESVSLNLNLVDPATHRSWPIINQGGNTSNILVNLKILR